MTDTFANPTNHEQTSLETLILGFDVSAMLAVGESPSAPAARMVNIQTGADYSTTGISGSPSAFAANISNVTVHALQPGSRYRLDLSFSITGGKTASTSIYVTCPF